MNTHELKTWPEFFRPIVEGRKTFEIRENDRDFSVGDILVLREFRPCRQCNGTGRYREFTDMEDCGRCGKTKGRYTGKRVRVLVIYITDYGQPGKQVVMAIRKLECVDEEIEEWMRG